MSTNANKSRRSTVGTIVVSTWVKVDGRNECVSVRARPGECSEALNDEIARLFPSVQSAELDRAVVARFISG